MKRFRIKKIMLLMICSIMIFLASCSNRHWYKNFNGYAITYVNDDTLIKKLQKVSDVLFIYDYSVQGKLSEDYLFLSLQNKKWNKVLYKKKISYKSEGHKTTMQKSFTYEETIIDKSIGDAVLSVFVNNKFWQISGDDDGCYDYKYKKINKNQEPNCGNISDAAKSIVSLYIKTKVSTKSYYAPEFFLKCPDCPGNDNRRIFVACKSALLSIK